MEMKRNYRLFHIDCIIISILGNYEIKINQMYDINPYICVAFK